MSTQARTSIAALALLATLGLGVGGVAHAHGADVYWSIDLSSPGVSVGLSNAPVVVPALYPVVVAPRPRVIYVPPPVYYPAPVYRVVYPGHHGHGHWRGRHGGWEERREYREHDHGGHHRDRGGERREWSGHGTPPYLGRR